MIEHTLLKLVHQGTVALSFAGFALRGGLMLGDSPLLMRRWMRTWPHLIDTLLLVSGIWMAVNLHLNPIEHPWLSAKLIALLIYIGLGFIALRLGRTRRQRILALLGALLCFAYVVMVALTRSVFPF